MTIAGFILDLAGEIPEPGRSFTRGEWTFRVQSVERRRISEVVVERHPRADDGAPGGGGAAAK